MAKIEHDKYYTPDETVNKCVGIVRRVLKGHKVSDIIEPSAGDGAFLKFLPSHISTGYDIEPEHENIIRQDFLELDLSYKKDRLIIGNPPFGSRMSLAQKFFKKSIELGDFVAFILPISQLNNTNSLYEFDLVYSEDLGNIKYSDRDLNCCFNIYKRPKEGLNKKPSSKLESVEMVRQDSKKFLETENYTLRMCYWGDGSAGKILKEGESYSAEYKITVKNGFEEKVKEVLNNIKWKEELNCIAMLKIQQFHIVHALKKYIPEIY